MTLATLNGVQTEGRGLNLSEATTKRNGVKERAGLKQRHAEGTTVRPNDRVNRRCRRQNGRKWEGNQSCGRCELPVEAASGLNDWLGSSREINSSKGELLNIYYGMPVLFTLRAIQMNQIGER